MPIRRRAWLTREGWYYLALLAFVLGGAVIRSGNLLLILAGMMIAPLIFNWRLVIAGLTGLTIERQLPSQISAGEPFTVAIRVENTRWWFSAWLLAIEDRIERHSHDSRCVNDSPCNPNVLIPHVAAGGTAVGTYRVNLHQRGLYRLGPLRCRTRFPLGLVEGQIRLPSEAQVRVAPRIGRLLPAWAGLIEAEQPGDERRNLQRGISEGDYYGLRPWKSGDSMRWIHWRTTAKLARPMVRQYERRKSREIAIVLDPWVPHSLGPQRLSCAELAISLTATAIHDLSLRGYSRLTLAVAGKEVECTTGPASPAFCEELLSRLSSIGVHSGSNISGALKRAVEAAPHGAQLVIISSRAPSDPSFVASSDELSFDPDDLAWIDASSEQLSSLFTLDCHA